VLAEREAEAQRKPEAEVAAPSTGRVVVEIKQPPRRGRGEERRARRTREEQDALTAPAAPPAAAPAAAPAASEEGTAPAPVPESGTEPVQE